MIYFIGERKLIKTELYDYTTIEECVEYFKNKNIIQVDTETTFNKGRLANPYDNKVLCIQLGDKNNQFVIDTSIYSIALFKDLLEDKSKVKIFTNAFFDLRFLFHYGIRCTNIYDCFLVEMLLTLGKNMEKGYRSLESMARRYCEIQLNKEVRGQIHYRGLDDTVIRYAAEDVSFMEEIREKQLILVKRDNLQGAIDLENRYVVTLANMSYRGYKVDPEKWIKVSLDNKKKLEKIKLQLSSWIIENKLTEFTNKGTSLLLFDDAEYCTINWKSSKQVVPLFKKLGINTIMRDKATGLDKDSVDIKILRRQLKKSSIVPIYIRYKELEKEIDTYGESFITEHLNKHTKRIHSEYFQLLETGRISSSNPNLQSIPAADEEGDVHALRKCFIPGEGNVLIVADYSQQEPRLTAEYSKDPYLIDFILNGDGDSHSLISTIISGHLLGEEVKVSKYNNPVVPKYKQKIRSIGKVINLGLDYGKTAFSIKEDLECSQEEAQKLIDVIKEKTPVKEAYFKRCFNFVLANGYIITDTYTNRRAYFDRYKEFLELSKIPYDSRTKVQLSQYFKLRGAMERFARNTPVQGSGGSMTKLASIIFSEKLQELGLSEYAYLVNAIHDELNAECSKETQQVVKKVLEESMVEAGKYFCATIPMIVEAIIGDSWGCKA